MRLSIFVWKTLRRMWRSRRSPATGPPATAPLQARASQPTQSMEQGAGASHEQADQDFRLRELLDQLTTDERAILIRHQAGFSEEEIVRHRGASASGVAELLTRVARKVKRLASRDQRTRRG